MIDESKMPDMAMAVDELYKEEIFTDQKVGTLRRMTPITADGEVDPTRKVLYLGSAQMMTPAGALPLSFELEVDSLSDAVAQFGEEAKKALERTVEELKEMQRKAASSIVVPGQGGGGMPGGGMPGGGIQMP